MTCAGTDRGFAPRSPHNDEEPTTAGALLQRPMPGTVHVRMILPCCKFKVLNTIIRLVTVDVMHNLTEF